jgi:hypothetical protein
LAGVIRVATHEATLLFKVHDHEYVVAAIEIEEAVPDVQSWPAVGVETKVAPFADPQEAVVEPTGTPGGGRVVVPSPGIDLLIMIRGSLAFCAIAGNETRPAEKAVAARRKLRRFIKIFLAKIWSNLITIA